MDKKTYDVRLSAISGEKLSSQRQLVDPFKVKPKLTNLDRAMINWVWVIQISYLPGKFYVSLKNYFSSKHRETPKNFSLLCKGVRVALVKTTALLIARATKQAGWLPPFSKISFINHLFIFCKSIIKYNTIDTMKMIKLCLCLGFFENKGLPLTSLNKQCATSSKWISIKNRNWKNTGNISTTKCGTPNGPEYYQLYKIAEEKEYFCFDSGTKDKNTCIYKEPSIYLKQE